MQSDDPAAYTTTVTTDEEGNEVSNSVYQGTTEDLLSIIKDLRARITELESGSTVDSDFESRVASLETDMARFKAI